MVWYNKPEMLEEMVVFRRRTKDFSDSTSALVIKIIQEEFLAKICKPDLTRHAILYGPYADNYNSLFQSKTEYLRVKTGMEEVHKQIGLPLKKHIHNYQNRWKNSVKASKRK